jgi:hypothetical protein
VLRSEFRMLKVRARKGMRRNWRGGGREPSAGATRRRHLVPRHGSIWSRCSHESSPSSIARDEEPREPGRTDDPLSYWFCKDILTLASGERVIMFPGTKGPHYHLRRHMILQGKSG